MMKNNVVQLGAGFYTERSGGSVSMDAVQYWAAYYLGIPYEKNGRDGYGVDCWGLCRLVMAEMYAIALPSYVNELKRDGCNVADLIKREVSKWQKIVDGEEKAGDIYVMMEKGRPCATYIIVGGGQLLYTKNLDQVRLVSYIKFPYYYRFGVYRYKCSLY